jgi:ABC-type uncharacterized transport system substrate-binding protein
MMERRTFLGTLGLSALAAPHAAPAQPVTKVYRIGLLGGTPTTAEPRLWEGFFQELRERGYVEGRNTIFDGRWYGDHTERLPVLAAELVQLKVDVIVAGAAPAPEAAQRATSTIPIVMAYHPDPVGVGLVSSLASPGKNITGMSVRSPELVGKQLQLLREAVPGISRVALLSSLALPSNALAVKEAQVAARSLKMQLQVLQVRTPGDLTPAFSAMTKDRVGGFVVLGGSIFFAERTRIAELATQSRLPSIYVVRQFAEAGGLMAYGPSIRDSLRRAATYVDRILKGAKPADLPVEQPTKFDLVINLKTARALGLTIPPALLGRADEVIE